MVSRLLLGADGGTVRSGSHEPRLDGADRGVHRGGEAAAWPVAARRTVAVLLLFLGLDIVIAPADVPGFAEPGMSMPDSGGSQGDVMR